MVYIDKYVKLNSLTRVQSQIYPTSNLNLKYRNMNFMTCKGNVDQKNNGYINGWLACKENGNWKDCGNVGIFFIADARIDDYFICTSRERPDVNKYLSVPKGEFGFEGFIRKQQGKAYLGFFHDSDVILCDNINIQ